MERRDQVECQYTISSIFQTLFSNEQVARWLLSKQQVSPTAITPQIMNNSITADQVCLGDLENNAHFFQRVDYDGRVGEMGEQEAEAEVKSKDEDLEGRMADRSAGREKIVFVLHGYTDKICFMSLTDSRSPFSFLEPTSTLQPGVRRAVAMRCDDDHLVLAMHFWLVDERSVLAFFRYSITSCEPTEKFILLLGPYPEYRYPTENDVIESCVSREDLPCRGCLTKGLLTCECSPRNVEHNSRCVPLHEQGNPWSCWSFIYGHYESGLSKYDAQLRNHAKDVTVRSEFSYHMVPTFLRRDSHYHAHRDAFQHYIDSLAPFLGDKIISWGELSQATSLSSLVTGASPKRRLVLTLQENKAEITTGISKRIEDEDCMVGTSVPQLEQGRASEAKRSMDELGLIETVPKAKRPCSSSMAYKKTIQFLLNPEPSNTNEEQGMKQNTEAAAFANCSNVAKSSKLEPSCAVISSGRLAPEDSKTGPSSAMYFNAELPGQQQFGQFGGVYYPSNTGPNYIPTFQAQQWQSVQHPQADTWGMAACHPYSDVHTQQAAEHVNYAYIHQQQPQYPQYPQHPQHPQHPQISQPIPHHTNRMEDSALRFNQNGSTVIQEQHQYPVPQAAIEEKSPIKLSTAMFPEPIAVRSNRGRRPTKSYAEFQPSNDPQDEHQNMIFGFLNYLDKMHWGPTTRETCRFCTLSFVRKYDLKRHVKAVHLREREHACQDCGCKFKRRQHLDAHMNQIHQKTSFVCEHCSRDFTSYTNMRRHVRTFHEKEERDAGISSETE